ncbi:hypothetical protein [Dactylosporangium sp. CA-233914]|uniref:hypothetical protein n=1 Tax=Dactylosporangium sp. CA-233914 TaxID=3239934 RepID=UPI003D8F1378
MSEPSLSEPSNERVLIAGQLVGAGAVGAAALPMTLWAVLSAAFGRNEGAGVAALAIAAVVVVAALTGVVTVTRDASPLGRTVVGRVFWAVLVAVFGTIGWVAGWAVTDAVGPRVSDSHELWVLFGGVSFALTAALFVRGWAVRTAAAGTVVMLLAAGLVALRRDPGEDLDARLRAAGLSRDTAYVVAIPGYAPDRDFGHGLGVGSFRPADPAKIPPDRYISITATDQAMTGEQLCGQVTAQDSRLAWGDCTVEDGGLVYRHNEIQHGYQVTAGRYYVTVLGTPGVSHDALRAAVTSLHPATAAELGPAGASLTDVYAATVPGYTGQPMGIPPGMLYAPSDLTGGGALSVGIELRVSGARSGDLCFGTDECAADGPDLTYFRRHEQQGYVMHRGSVDVAVLGGLRVDRALLRQAVLDARPATDDELRRGLSVAPPRAPSTGLDRFRQWLRSL